MSKKRINDRQERDKLPLCQELINGRAEESAEESAEGFGRYNEGKMKGLTAIMKVNEGFKCKLFIPIAYENHPLSSEDE